MLHDCLWEIQYPCGSVCLGKYPGRALLQLAFEDGTLWTPDVGNCLLPTRTAIWGCAVHFLKWLFLTRRTTPHCWQPSVEQISLELVEITGSKGRSQRDFPFFPTSASVWFSFKSQEYALLTLKNMLQNKAATFLLWKPNEEIKLKCWIIQKS